MKPKHLLAAAAFTVFSASAFSADQLISGPGSTLTQARCVLCHDAGLIVGVRLNRDGWQEMVNLMLTRGMPPLSDSELTVILDYLTTFYGPNPAPPAGPDTLASSSRSTGNPATTDGHLLAMLSTAPSLASVHRLWSAPPEPVGTRVTAAR